MGECRIEFTDLKLGMFLISNEPGLIFSDPTGGVVSYIDESGFYIRDDRHHNCYWFEKPDLSKFRFIDCESQLNDEEKKQYSNQEIAFYINWVLKHDVGPGSW